jgi:hypothetical protein
LGNFQISRDNPLQVSSLFQPIELSQIQTPAKSQQRRIPSGPEQRMLQLFMNKLISINSDSTGSSADSPTSLIGASFRRKYVSGSKHPTQQPY